MRLADHPQSSTSTRRRLSQFSFPNFRVPTIADIVDDMGRSLEYEPSGEEDDDVWEIEIVSREIEIAEDAANENMTV